MKRVVHLVAPGGTAELRDVARIELRDPETGLRLREATPDEIPGSTLVGMRSSSSGREVPGTRHGYTCARCGEGVRLAPSGQRMQAAGAPVWCIECYPHLGGPSA
jgi:hypothetical protein